MSPTSKADINYVVRGTYRETEGDPEPLHYYLKEFVGANAHHTFLPANSLVFDSVEEAEGAANTLRGFSDNNYVVVCIDRETLNHNDCTPIGALS